MTALSIKDQVTPFSIARWTAVHFALLLLIFIAPTAASGQLSVSEDGKTLVVANAGDMEIIAYGKTVIVKGQAKGVLAFGGDIVVEGRVEGDVASIGGSVIQKEQGYIGGDLFVLGGTYRPEISDPLRAEGKETLLYAGYEDELKELVLNPASLLTPEFTAAFFAQRVLSVLFWFLVSLAIATIAPGAVSRASARLQLSSLKVVGVGLGVLVLSTITVVGSLSVLPSYLGAILGLMAFALLLLAYVFGRVALHVAFGKLIQKTIFPNGSRSDAIAILLGVAAWTLLLSVPFLWTLALIALFAAGIGLVFTARSQKAFVAR